MQIPEEPLIFFKSTTSPVGPNDEVMIPKNGHKLDGDIELAVVMILEVPDLASYLREFMTFLSGHVISAGAPASVGWEWSTPDICSPAILSSWA
jgi:2,4-diketo-3-deoxy-L-fuconate hydrolase